MTSEELLSTAVGVLNVAVVVALVVHVRRLGITPPFPLVMLAAVFGVRAVARLVPPLGAETTWLSEVLDAVLLVALLTLLFAVRRLVDRFALQREAVQRARVDYDEALFHHEAVIADRACAALDQLDRSLDRLDGADATRDRRDALTEAREAAAVLRARALDPPLRD